MSATQLGLFAPAADIQRSIDALTCLREAMPEALEIVVHLAYWRPVDNREVGACGDWAYSLRQKGLCFERVDDWWNGARSRGETWGWDRTPAGLVTWTELAEHVGGDSRRPGLVAWSRSLTVPDAWRDRARPHELWPNPGQWNPGYITSDHARPGWDQRIAAWRTLFAILDDAIDRLTAGATA